MYAVGVGGTILHFDGAGWSRMASPTDALLLDVWGLAPDDIYAVGFNGFGVVIAHWNGTRWTSVPTPDAGGVAIQEDVEQTGIGEGNEGAPLWAVGSLATNSGELALVFQGP